MFVLERPLFSGHLPGEAVAKKLQWLVCNTAEAEASKPSTSDGVPFLGCERRQSERQDGLRVSAGSRVHGEEVTGEVTGN